MCDLHNRYKNMTSSKKVDVVLSKHPQKKLWDIVILFQMACKLPESDEEEEKL